MSNFIAQHTTSISGTRVPGKKIVETEVIANIIYFKQDFELNYYQD